MHGPDDDWKLTPMEVGVSEDLRSAVRDLRSCLALEATTRFEASNMTRAIIDAFLAMPDNSLSLVRIVMAKDRLPWEIEHACYTMATYDAVIRSDDPALAGFFDSWDYDYLSRMSYLVGQLDACMTLAW